MTSTPSGLTKGLVVVPTAIWLLFGAVMITAAAFGNTFLIVWCGVFTLSVILFSICLLFVFVASEIGAAS